MNPQYHLYSVCLFSLTHTYAFTFRRFFVIVSYWKGPTNISAAFVCDTDDAQDKKIGDSRKLTKSATEQ